MAREAGPGAACRRLRACLVLSALLPGPASDSALAQVVLPTPLEHYEQAEGDATTRALLLELLAALPEEARARAVGLLAGGDGRAVDPLLGREALSALAASPDWARVRPRLVKLLLHVSGTLDAIPPGARDWVPLVHDALLLFLDKLRDERLLARLASQAELSRDATRGDRIFAFLEETPSLQKLAQILARNPSLDPEVRLSLQRVENSLETMSIEEVREQLGAAIDAETVRRYEIRFAEGVLAEASVGAVIEARLRDPDSGAPLRAACKVLKPRAVAALHEDLAIVDEVLAYLERNGSFYGIGAAPLVDIFEELRDALSREVLVEDEQANLRRAAAYYLGETRVKIPAVYSFSTPHVTCMEFIEGVKVTDAFVGNDAERARLARRLSDLLTFDVLFSGKPVSLFHGDPHAGNLFHAAAASETAAGRASPAPDPLRIALLDWGLASELSLADREKLSQLLLGLYLGHAKRIANNVGALVNLSGEPEERDHVRALVDRFLDESDGLDAFEGLDELVTRLAKEGFAVHFRAAMFIKAQLTLAGILSELDPSFEQDRYLRSRLRRQVLRETPKRLFRTVWFPAWNSHDYRSLMSNEDVKDAQLVELGRALKAAGRAIGFALSFRWLF